VKERMSDSETEEKEIRGIKPEAMDICHMKRQRLGGSAAQIAGLTLADAMDEPRFICLAD
jgi:hypothetical protein